jgi:hypothetical protein
MSLQNAIDRFPRQVPGPGGKDYRRLDSHYAVHGTAAAEASVAPAFTLGDGSIRVYERGDDERPPEAPVSAVYAQEDGPPAVPTGDVFVRFVEGVRVEERRRQLKSVGYDIVRVPSYAPHAAWVRASGGDAAESLRGMAALQAVGDVVGVEPQMLMRAARR